MHDLNTDLNHFNFLFEVKICFFNRVLLYVTDSRNKIKETVFKTLGKQNKSRLSLDYAMQCSGPFFM